MIILETPRLTVRNWRDDDRDLFREINADAKVMEFFAQRRSHAEADAMMDKVRRLITETGYGFFAVELQETGEAIGFCGLAPANIEPVLPEDTIEIGWRMATRFWGNGYMTEAALSLLDYAFAEKKLDEVVSFAVAGNLRSRAVMKRIGMVHDESADFDHPRVPDSHPHLQRHVLYRIAAAAHRPVAAARS
ncbi:GNAT family N-acetyltransferase [Rhizobium sp. CG5]|uniref:GNAT family N-acetyltransferase n=1 Tax=Rhizobium sp. CG5 TaxID=2726076 RepID=UPI002033A337|nr:GNAT family N-acetyltransferase [Rhizobium sp. CG5]